MHNFYRCFDRYRRPVVAIAIFCGPDGRKLPGRYEYSCLNTRLHYEYTTLRLLDFSDAELADSTNPFAWVLLAAKDALKRGKNLDERLLQGKLFVFRKLYENGVFERRKLQAILSFLSKYVQFENRESYRIFNEEIDKITHKAKTMDIFEQIAEIRVEETREEFVTNLLTKIDLPLEKVAELAGVSLDFVKEVKRGLARKKKKR